MTTILYRAVVTVSCLLPCLCLRTVCYFLFLVLYCMWCHSDVTHVHALLYMAWCRVTQAWAHVLSCSWLFNHCLSEALSSRDHISGDKGGIATPYGQIAALHHESDSIKAYPERVQVYFVANWVPEDVQVPILLSCIRAPTYSLLSDLFALSAPSFKSFQVISEALRNHFEPKGSDCSVISFSQVC